MLDLVTIGVYGWHAGDFFQALVAAHVDTFCDLRARRGVRGSEYAWANSRRLQARLGELGVRYLHCKELAPLQATRDEQYSADQAAGVAKRQRSVLSPAFIAAYRHQCLAGFDSHAFVAALGPQAQVAALFCVERDPAACHRSIVAQRLAGDMQLKVVHLVP